MVAVTWSVAANDQHMFAYFGKTTAALPAKEIAKQVKPGKIIMLPDGYGREHGDTRSVADLTVETLPMLIEYLPRQGYEFVTVPDLLQKQVYN